MSENRHTDEQHWHPFAQLILARLREFYREPEALFWVYAFPLLLAVVLGLAFGSRKPDPPVVDIQDSPDRTAAEAAAARLQQGGVAVQLLSAEECRERLRKAITSLYLVVLPGKTEYVFDPANSEAALARYWVEALLRRPDTTAPDWQETHPEQPGTRYIDFLLPGLIGMNIMGGGLFGVGFILVDMRVRKLFKRLMATPMRHSHFLGSLLTARLLFLLPEMLSLLVLARWLMDVPILGSVWLLLLVIVVGAAAFSGLGLLLGCRTDKTESMSAYINLIMLPSYLLCGIFFSSKRFPDAMQPFIQALPLTPLNNALRAVMLEGAGIDDVAIPLAVLLGWAIVTFTLALRWFKWR
jgi:ABC-2 type transport system permease protein